MSTGTPAYEWVTWFASPEGFTLTKGYHFTCSISTMQQQIRNQATARGRRVRIREDGPRLIVTFKPENTPRHAKDNTTAQLPRPARRSGGAPQSPA